MQLNNLNWESDNYHVLINPGVTLKLGENEDADDPKTKPEEPAEPPIGDHPEENETPAEGG